MKHSIRELKDNIRFTKRNSIQSKTSFFDTIEDFESYSSCLFIGKRIDFIKSVCFVFVYLNDQNSNVTGVFLKVFWRFFWRR